MLRCFSATLVLAIFTYTWILSCVKVYVVSKALICSVNKFWSVPGAVLESPPLKAAFGVNRLPLNGGTFTNKGKSCVKLYAGGCYIFSSKKFIFGRKKCFWNALKNICYWCSDNVPLAIFVYYQLISIYIHSFKIHMHFLFVCGSHISVYTGR